MTAAQRLLYIRDYVKDAGRVTVAELSACCGVTEETVRKDLEKLQGEGLLTRTHGGAVWNESVPAASVSHFFTRQVANAAEKRKIARTVAVFLEEGSITTLMADSSSTVLEALKAAAANPNLIAITNSLEAFVEVKDEGCTLISTGGTFNARSLSFQGDLTKANIRRYNARLALISCKGLDFVEGATDSYESEAAIKRVMLERAEEVALLVDHTKFNRTAFLRLSALDDIDYLVTDEEPDEDWKRALAAHGVKLIF